MASPTTSFMLAKPGVTIVSWTVLSMPVTAGLPSAFSTAFHAAAWSWCWACAVLAYFATAGGTAPSLPAAAASRPAWYVATALFSRPAARAAMARSPVTPLAPPIIVVAGAMAVVGAAMAVVAVVLATVGADPLLLLSPPHAARTNPPAVTPAAPNRKPRRLAVR